MAIGEICNRHVLFARREDTVKTAARLMREFHIGSVVVIDETNGLRQPVGIVTDRDITVAVLALGLDPEVIRVGDIMATELVTADDVLAARRGNVRAGFDGRARIQARGWFAQGRDIGKRRDPKGTAWTCPSRSNFTKLRTRPSSRA